MLIEKIKEFLNGGKLTATANTGQKYAGMLPTYHLTKSNSQVIKDTITWAKKIAKNKDFHYGKGKHSHHNGCYYCGTQPKVKKEAGIKKWKTTYCCNPFVGAAWGHGGCVPDALKLCKKGSSWGFGKNEGYAKSKLFTSLGKPSKSKLKPGDVLCSDGHVALYIGDGKVVQAGHEDDNKVNSKSWNSSIGIGTWNGWKRAYRFNGKVDIDLTMYHGEYSYRIKHLQEFLNWYYNAGLKVSGFYNDKTLKFVKKFQKEVGLKPTGKVGKKTIAAMKSASK